MKEANRVTAGLPSLTPGLRDTITQARINKMESDRRLTDHIARESATTAPDGSIDTTCTAQQIGIPMSAGELQRRLKLCNSNLVFEVSNHDLTKTGIYIIENRDGKTERRFICGMMTGISPERSIRVPKKREIPHPDGQAGHYTTVNVINEEIRGWRTVLVMLLHSRVITQPQIDRYFPVSNGISKNWQQFTT
jgi:hypothetical protein